jgi:hypothetical protein
MRDYCRIRLKQSIIPTYQFTRRLTKTYQISVKWWVCVGRAIVLARTLIFEALGVFANHTHTVDEGSNS